MSTTKYKFGWYIWNGFVYCERWDADVVVTPFSAPENSTVISEKEWNGPLSLLEERYKGLQPKMS